MGSGFLGKAEDQALDPDLLPYLILKNNYALRRVRQVPRGMKGKISVFIKIILIFIVLLGGSFSWNLSTVYAQGYRYWVAPPTILYPKNGEKIYTSQPIIKGVSFNDTIVEIYLNGKLDGIAKVKNHPSGTGSFSYKIKTHLENLSNYELKVKAKDINSGVESYYSDPVYFSTLLPPAPVIFLPKNNQVIKGKRRIDIKGVAKSGYKVNLMINGEQKGGVKTSKSPTGTSGFYFKSPRVKGGRIVITLYAVDEKGRVSPLTDLREVVVIPPYIPPTLRKIEKNGILEGVAHKNSKIEIYVNGKLDGSLIVKESPTGSVGFKYKIKNFKIGRNEIKARAYDLNTNWPSDDSNLLVYFHKQVISKPKKISKKTEILPPSPIEKEKKEGVGVEKGKISPEKPEQSKITKKETQEEKPVINWPFVIGIILLVFLILSMIIWYIIQKKEKINKSIETLIEKEEESEQKKEEQKQPVSEKHTEESSESSEKKEDKSQDSFPF